MSIELKRLIDLTESLNGDFRSCMNTLQSFKLLNGKPGRHDFSKLLDFSGKDIGHSEAEIVQDIFRKRNSNRNLKRSLDDAYYYISFATEKIVDLSRDVLLIIPFFDDIAMSKLNKAIDWFCFSDLTHFQYCGYAAAFINKYFTSNSPIPMGTYFKAAFERTLSSQRNYDILLNFLKLQKAERRVSLGGHQDVLCCHIPIFLQIVRDKIQSANYQLLKPFEKLELRRVAKLMAYENMTFVEHPASNNSELEVRLEPPIDKLTSLGSKQTQVANHHRRTVLKMIGFATQQERICASNKQTNRTDTFDKETPIANISRSVLGKRGQTICYKFNEGFSSAVRRKIQIKDIFFK